MELRIDQQWARLGLDIKKPQIKLETSAPAVQIQTSRRELEIEAPMPVLHIDQSQCFADAGLRNNEYFKEYCSQLSYSDYAQGLDRVVSEGHALANIENGVTIAQVAFNRCNPSPDPFTVTAIPKQPPRTWFDTFPVSYRFTPSKVDVNLRRGQVENHFERGSVNVYLAQKNYLEINWIQGKYDIQA